MCFSLKSIIVLIIFDALLNLLLNCRNLVESDTLDSKVHLGMQGSSGITLIPHGVSLVCTVTATF